MLTAGGYFFINMADGSLHFDADSDSDSEEFLAAKPVFKPRGLLIHVLVCVTYRVISSTSIISRSSTLIDFYMFTMI